LGLGHDVIADRLASTLEDVGWESRTLDCMGLLGRVESRVGDRVFRGLSARPSIYDSLHFSHFRPGSRLAMAMDRAATKRLVPAVEASLNEYGADLLISSFPTGARPRRDYPAGGPVSGPWSCAQMLVSTGCGCGRKRICIW
jgi:hypothetical protein